MLLQKQNHYSLINLIGWYPYLHTIVLTKTKTNKDSFGPGTGMNTQTHNCIFKSSVYSKNIVTRYTTELHSIDWLIPNFTCAFTQPARIKCNLCSVN